MQLGSHDNPYLAPAGDANSWLPSYLKAAVMVASLPGPPLLVAGGLWVSRGGIGGVAALVVAIFWAARLAVTAFRLSMPLGAAVLLGELLAIIASWVVVVAKLLSPH